MIYSAFQLDFLIAVVGWQGVIARQISVLEIGSMDEPIQTCGWECGAAKKNNQKNAEHWPVVWYHPREQGFSSARLPRSAWLLVVGACGPRLAMPEGHGKGNRNAWLASFIHWFGNFMAMKFSRLIVKYPKDSTCFQIQFEVLMTAFGESCLVGWGKHGATENQYLYSVVFGSSRPGFWNLALWEDHSEQWLTWMRWSIGCMPWKHLGILDQHHIFFPCQNMI